MRAREGRGGEGTLLNVAGDFGEHPGGPGRTHRAAQTRTGRKRNGGRGARGLTG